MFNLANTLEVPRVISYLKQHKYSPCIRKLRETEIPTNSRIWDFIILKNNIRLIWYIGLDLKRV